MKNSADPGGCYPPRPSASVDNTLLDLQNSSYPTKAEFPETKSRGIFTNIHEPEANNCFSIITQVIIEIPKQLKECYNFSSICHC